MDRISPNKISILPSFVSRDSRRNRTHVSSHCWLHRELTEKTRLVVLITYVGVCAQWSLRLTKSVERRLVVFTMALWPKRSAEVLTHVLDHLQLDRDAYELWKDNGRNQDVRYGSKGQQYERINNWPRSNPTPP